MISFMGAVCRAASWRHWIDLMPWPGNGFCITVGGFLITKCQWCAALVFYLLLAWASCWTTVDMQVIWDAITLMWRHSDASVILIIKGQPAVPSFGVFFVVSWTCCWTTVELPVIGDAITLIWRYCNADVIFGIPDYKGPPAVPSFGVFFVVSWKCC